MGYYAQPILMMFLGSPGSGKSYFAKAAADKLHAIRINGDSMRLAIFGSLDEIQTVYQSEGRPKVNSYTFNALDYAAEQIIMRGYDVVYDAHHNRRATREELERLAAKYNALPIVVWVKTPYEVALKRGQTREAQVDQRQLSEEKMRETMARHQASTDEPTDQERIIVIDGEMPFEGQFAAFEEQLRAMIDG